MDQGLLTTLGKRSAQRICTRSDVGILDEASGERLLGQLRDLSSTGACLRTEAALPVGKELRLAFEFAPGAEPVRLHAEVAWSGRDEGPRGGVRSGVRFLDLAGADFGRLRAFIDQKLWTVQRFLSSIELLADLNDLERLLLASTSFDREFAAQETLDESVSDDTLVIVRAGTFTCVETQSDGRVTEPRTLTAGDLGGALPIDPRGGTHLRLQAVTPAAVLVIPSDGFAYLRDTHAATALKVMTCWCLHLRDRLATVPAAESRR